MPKPIIICVDDEKIVLDSLRSELRSQFGAKYNIEVAESGDEALEIYNELVEDGLEVPLIISDYIMPEMKGDFLLEAINQKDPNMLKIMLTGQATIEGVTNAINKAGLYRYISKPWETNDMILTVTEALKSYDKDIELEQRRIALEIANKKLIKLDSAKTYFLGLLSHELNTPLIGINGNAKLIYEITDDQDVKESAIEILLSESRLRKFADLSLLITRIQTDKYETRFYDERFQDIIDQSLFNLSDKITQKNIDIVRDIPAEEYYIKADVSLIGKVIEFVLDNSIKYAPEESPVRISAKKDEDCLILSIMDQGEGFSEKSLENIFEFFVSSGELMSHSEGSGLSLAAAKVIMDLHNFEIKAKNSDTGGAIVEMIFQLVTLPLDNNT
jgi:two-component system sensor histidine kinase/response regulator